MIKPIEILRPYPNPRMERHYCNSRATRKLFPNLSFDNTRPIYREGKEYISNLTLPLPDFDD